MCLPPTGASQMTLNSGCFLLRQPRGSSWALLPEARRPLGQAPGSPGTRGGLMGFKTCIHPPYGFQNIHIIVAALLCFITRNAHVKTTEGEV